MKRLATEQEQTHASTKGDRSGPSAGADGHQPPKKKRKRVQDKVQQSHTPARGDGEQNASRKKRKDGQKNTRGDKAASLAAYHPTPRPSANALTTLQRGMKHSLVGARFRYVKPRTQDAINCARPAFFRWINEKLYKSDGAHAHAMMREDPAVFDDVRPSCLSLPRVLFTARIRSITKDFDAKSKRGHLTLFLITFRHYHRTRRAPSSPILVAETLRWPALLSQRVTSSCRSTWCRTVLS